MKKTAGLSLIALIVVLLGTEQIDAQDSGIFSGRGFGDGSSNSNGSTTSGNHSFFGAGSGNSTEATKKSAFAFPKFEMPKLGKPKLEMPKIEKPKWEMPRLFQNQSYPKAIELTDSDERGFWSGAPKFDLLSGRKSGEPNFFQRMNDRTKEAFDKTRQGMSNLTGGGNNSGGTGTRTWDRITKGPNGDIGGSGNRNQPPVQPNLRSARSETGSGSRF